MGGGFNARTGKEVMVVGEEEEGEGGRGERSRKINGETRKLVDFLEERGWGIFNGNVRGEGEIR